MKFDKLKKEKENLEVVSQEKYLIEKKHIKTIFPHENHTLFKVNIITREVSKVEFKKELTYSLRWNWTKKDKININKEINIEDGFIYISALNEKNVIDKLNKGIDGSKVFFNEKINL